MKNTKLVLHQELYEKEIIEKTIEAYRSIAKIKLEMEDNYYICIFYRCKYDVSITKNEFANYLIDLANLQE